MTSGPTRTLPWSIADARAAFLPIIFGAMLLAWGWWEASGTGNLDEQTTAVVFALLAAGVVVAGSFAWVAAGRRAVRLRREKVLGQLERHGLLGRVWAVSDAEADGLVAVAGTTRYHRPDCLLVQGKDVEPVTADGRASAGRVPCEMCRP